MGIEPSSPPAECIKLYMKHNKAKKTKAKLPHFYRKSPHSKLQKSWRWGGASIIFSNSDKGLAKNLKKRPHDSGIHDTHWENRQEENAPHVHAGRRAAGCGTVARNGRSKKRLQNVEGSAYRASYNIDLYRSMSSTYWVMVILILCLINKAIPIL